jgi:hypothetical protein
MRFGQRQSINYVCLNSHEIPREHFDVVTRPDMHGVGLARAGRIPKK